MSSVNDAVNATNPSSPPATPPPTPTWVKVFAVVGAVVLLLILGIVVANVAGLGVEHGPGRHLGGNAQPSSSTPPGSTTSGPENADTSPAVPRAQSPARATP